jgi:hypothetical protein
MQATRLREAPSAQPHAGEIIDASFTVVPQRTLWRRIKVALFAAMCAAVIGFLIPPLWIVAQHVVPVSR